MPDASDTTVKVPSHISVNKTIILQLSLIIVLGALLRFYGLSSESLWLDELSTFRAGSYPTISQMISQWAAPNVHPPAYYIIIWILQKLWTDSEFVLRLPSAVAGVLAIPAIFLLGKKLFSHREGLIAAGLLAVLWCPVFYSQEAKAYQILLLFVIIATFFWMDILRDLSRGIAFPTSKAYPYAVTAVICCYLNYSGLYLILLQLVASVAFAARKPDRRRVRRIYLTVCILYLPWLPWMLWQFICSHRMVAWIPQPSASHFLKFLSFISIGHYDASTIHNLAIFAFLVLLGFLIIKETRRTRAVADSSRLRQFLLSSQGILLLWLALPFLILFIVSLLIRPIITERYLIISLPAAYLLLARSLTALPLRPIARSILVWLLIFACLLHLINGAGYYSRPQKQQLREAVSFIV